MVCVWCGVCMVCVWCGVCVVVELWCVVLWAVLWCSAGDVVCCEVIVSERLVHQLPAQCVESI